MLLIMISVANLHPDLSFHVDADPDLIFHFDADPDLYPSPAPAPLQKDTTDL
jgi:hypothetical protein